MPTIFLDESGYTGPNHLDDAQPVFVLASIGLPEAECKELRQRFFPTIRAKELKHAKHAKEPAFQRGVLGLLEHLSQRPGAVKMVVTHKRFALICKMIDVLVEPVLRLDGFDVYDRGANIAMANVMHCVLPVLGGRPAYLESLLGRFQVLMRDRSALAYDAFFEPLFSTYPHDEIENLLLPMKLFHVRYGLDEIRDWPSNALDIAAPSLFVLMGAWRDSLNVEFDVVHDESANMAKAKDIWAALTVPDVPETVVGYDRRTIRFPLLVTDTRFCASHAFVGLQLADVLAGAMERHARDFAHETAARDAYSVALAEFSGWDRLDCRGILPSRDVTPDDLGTNISNAVDPNEFVKGLLTDAPRRNAG